MEVDLARTVWTLSGAQRVPLASAECIDTQALAPLPNDGSFGYSEAIVRVLAESQSPWELFFYRQ
jgi:hypothetical protein